MNTRNTLIVVIALIVIASAVSAFLAPRMPEQMASHWNAVGEVDGYMSRFWGVALMPLFAVGLAALFLLIPQIDPLRANIAKFRVTFNSFIALVIAFLLYIHALTLAWNLGYTFNMSLAMLPAMGLLFIFIGVLLRRAKRNWFIGIRTPWTLSSDSVWEKTHRVGAWLFPISGLLCLLGIFFGENGFWFLLVPLLGSTVFLVVYSYVLYQREEMSNEK